MGLHASFELRTRSNIPKYGPIQPDLARTLKHLAHTRGNALNNMNYNSVGHYRLYDPPMAGAFQSFFMNYSIEIRDVLSPKHYAFRYFKDELGLSYESFLNKTIKFKYLRPVSEYKQKIKYRLGLEKRPDHQLRPAFLKSADFTDNFLSMCDPKQSYILGHLNDGNVKDYVEKLYQSIYDKHYPDFMKINQILNLEYFFRKISQG